MIPLNARGTPHRIDAGLIGKVQMGTPGSVAAADRVVVLDGPIAEAPPGGCLAVITSGPAEWLPRAVAGLSECPVDHLGDGDVVSIMRDGRMHTLYRRVSPHNSLFATDRCNSLCLMCSQPPREVDESGKVKELIRIVNLIDSTCGELGITGGEPTLLGDGLLEVIAECRDKLPATALHLLSNGRRFVDNSYAARLGAVKHPDLMVGIPVYSDLDSEHDYVVQARGAFRETVAGCYHLAAAGVRIEIRIVVHRGTYARLPQLARFIYRNLTFAAHVTFMGLEAIGYAKTNMAKLWIDPLDYTPELESAVLYLSTAGMRVSIYNHQLCTLPESLWPFSRRSISDWKNEYLDICTSCGIKDKCGGFFAWNLAGHTSRGIRPVSAN